MEAEVEWQGIAFWVENWRCRKWNERVNGKTQGWSQKGKGTCNWVVQGINKARTSGINWVRSCQKPLKWSLNLERILRKLVRNTPRLVDFTLREGEAL